MTSAVRTRLLTVVAVLTVVGAGTVAAVSPSSAESPPGRYVVVYRDAATAKTSADALTARLTRSTDVSVGHRYRYALQGFAATMSPATADRIAQDPGVAYVEPVHNFRVSTMAQPAAVDTESGPPWGLDRIDQRRLPLDGIYATGAASGRGNGVTAYVVDTGTEPMAEFGGRAVWGTNTTGDGNDHDCNGHGTHVGGTIGGSYYGVAKQVRLVSVKALGCDGGSTTDKVLAGIDWVVADHTSGPAVANMSFGGPADAAVDTAVKNLFADGVTVVAASGNANADACGSSPARVGQILTVNASTIDDVKADFSNYGPCTDIFAPGQYVESIWPDGSHQFLDGTSMAAPHVTGTVARLLSVDPSLTPGQMGFAVLNSATVGAITGVPARTPNRFVLARPPYAAVTLCSDNKLKGRCTAIDQDIPSMSAVEVGNDALSSIGGSPKGQWLLVYSDINFAGTCQAFDSSRDVLAGTTIGNDTASSVRYAISKEDCGGLAITKVSPASGPLSGRNIITLAGTGLRSVRNIYFGGVPGKRAYGVGGDPSFYVQVPPGAAPGKVDVVVTTDGNRMSSAVTDKTTYTYKR